jgi:flagellar basal body-associated protein FliL
LAETTGPQKKENDSEDAGKESVGLELELSDEDIDAALTEADPEFLNQINQVSKDKDLSLPSIEISDEDQALNDEKDLWASSSRFGRAVFRLYPGVARLSLRLKRFKFKMVAFVQDRKVRLKNFLYFLVTTGKEKLKEGLRHRLTMTKEKLSKASSNYKYMPLKGKATVIGLFLLAIGTAAFIYLSFTRGFFQGRNDLFVTSLENVADQAYSIKADDAREPFYDNLRFGNHLLLIQKMVVNLKKSAKSTATPMGAFEFYVEGTNEDVLVEIKDREVELRDLMYRTLEDFSFDQADSSEGKEQIADKLRKELNLTLTQGKVRRVWFKTAIVKP